MSQNDLFEPEVNRKPVQAKMFTTEESMAYLVKRILGSVKRDLPLYILNSEKYCATPEEIDRITGTVRV